jgi:hypothetical protein
MQYIPHYLFVYLHAEQMPPISQVCMHEQQHLSACECMCTHTDTCMHIRRECGTIVYDFTSMLEQQHLSVRDCMFTHTHMHMSRIYGTILYGSTQQPA